MFTEIIDNKRRGKEIIDYKGGINTYIRDMLLEIGFSIEKNTGRYIRVSMDQIGEIVIHTNNNNGEGIRCVNVYLPKLRTYEIMMYSGMGVGHISYIYKEEKVEKERLTLSSREFTDKILEQIRKIWEIKKCIQK